ncbi:vWA domain-containing protein [Roseibium aggregatum]|uniref:vWA domain-containing protein n=1 Tax=Roseibium aggregatum TaxID=187304 RepID=UPI001E36A7DD|nr:VWA domain-containing protein [Roseibium aggregatum]
MFILDGSGSMWGQIDKVAKITTAKETMTQLMDNVPAEARIGLMTYGTTDKKSCRDVRVLNPVGASRSDIKDSIAAIKPLGKTPISWSLAMGMEQLVASEPTDVQKSLVLISDGIETCDGDPCTIAAGAPFLGVNMKVHVVGFDVDAQARQQLQCIAEKGGGKYFDVSNTAGFGDAMAEVIQVAQAAPEPAPVAEPEPEPEPAGPVITEFFREDFDGEALGENFTIVNENSENYIVEGGVLTILSTHFGGFDAAEPENLIEYTGDMPSGDWDVEIQFTGEFTTMADRLTLGLRKDNKSYLATGYYGIHTVADCEKTEMALTKAAGGSSDTHTRPFRTTKRGQCYHNRPFGGEDGWDPIQADHLEKPVKLTLSKRGREYTSKVEMVGFTDPDGNPYILESDKYTSLRSPGKLSLLVDRMKEKYVTGEVLMMIDSLVINEVKDAGE